VSAERGGATLNANTARGIATHWQLDRERRALAALRAHIDTSTERNDDALGNAEAESGALTPSFGGEETVEYVVELSL
jgi:hypothetical protein